MATKKTKVKNKRKPYIMRHREQRIPVARARIKMWIEATKEHGMKRRMAEATGISYSRLRNILSYDNQVTIKQLKKIQNWIDRYGIKK